MEIELEQEDLFDAPLVEPPDSRWEAFGFDVSYGEEEPTGEEDEAARFLAQAREERIVKPMRAEISRVYDNGFAFLKGDSWQERQKAFLENPDDPDAIFELAKKLVDTDSPESLEAAKRLIFLPGENGQDAGALPKFRWPEHEDLIILAALIFRKEKKFGAVMKILTDSDHQPRFPGNSTAKRFLAQALNEFHYYETAADMIRQSNEEELYRDPILMLNFVRALLKLGQDEEIFLLFSGANPLFRANARTRFMRPTLDFLHREKRFDLMFHIIEQVMFVNPKIVTEEHFVDFASRAFNEAGQFAKTVRLLAAAESPIRGRFPHNVHCMKNLAYALIGLARRPDAEAVIDEALANGLPRKDFFHLDRRLRGGSPPPKQSHRRDPITEL